MSDRTAQDDSATATRAGRMMWDGTEAPPDWRPVNDDEIEALVEEAIEGARAERAREEQDGKAR